jgi:hypothetical protein
MRHTPIFVLCLALIALSTTACTHALQVKNLDIYATSVHLVSIEPPIKVAVLPYTGDPDGLFYFNTLVERLNQRTGIGEIRTDYLVGKTGQFKPDVILAISPQVNYRSSGWNFLINWPGFLIFTPAWNGYVYHADIMTEITIHDGKGNVLSTSKIPISYDIREAEMDRTIWTGLTWFEVSLLAFSGGIYNANVFDRDIIGTLEGHIRDNYATFISNQMQPKVQAAVDTLRAQGSATEDSTHVSPSPPSETNPSTPSVPPPAPSPPSP